MVEAAGIDASGGWPKLQFSYAKAAEFVQEGGRSLRRIFITEKEQCGRGSELQGL